MNQIQDFHATDHTRDVLLDVAHKRRQQIAKGYTLEHDDKYTTREMVKFANWRFYPSPTSGLKAFSRETFIEAIAILVAAVEVMDRRKAKS